ncbi:methyltransferase domain-containing protein [Aliiglaciecola sp. LCG003]|uniref:methyltransferase domain-containing protein n=1 Tax=Aliiglaciecola sp. LCG003 TaxID=3053655 RepID=UPI002574579D|nr:methyltransferase domain-containing protein [Aliiglaciecola sp. LCG003]WJG10594.1 methyltransferase domain-containing protein [Aliiglaciecola sp. LCG003]
MRNVDKCKVCQSEQLDSLLELPGLPLSETYGVYEPDFKNFDQGIDICACCGHVQLAFQLPPSVLYNESDYNYSTAKSSSTIKRFNSFREFIGQTMSHQTESIIDIGGNDISLLSLFDVEHKYLVDPSVAKHIDYQDVKTIKGFVEDIDLAQISPQVVVCSHALEHIAEPRKFIQTLLDKCDENTLFYFEVPCFEKQIAALRFDAFFHQHFHYFHPTSIHKLVDSCDGELISIQYNAYPTCGGAVMFAFKRRLKGTKASVPLEYPIQSVASLKQAFHANYATFKKQNIQISKWLTQHSKVYGYGASLLLPVILYHIGEAAKKITLVFDDDQSKTGFTYKNIQDLKVDTPSGYQISELDGILITSYENIPILDHMIKKRFVAERFEGFTI